MPKSWGLTLKLALAFLAVSAVTLAIVLFAVERSTSSNFRSYVQHQQMMQQGMTRPGAGPGTMAPLVDSAQQSFFDRLRLSFVLGGIGGATLALAAGVVVARKITRPVCEIESAARAVADGDVTRRVTVSGNDELGKLAASFNSMAEALASQERARQRFIADVAHELRTPLAVLQGEIEALQDGVTEPEAERLESLHEETQLLTRLVDDLRTLSLADAGELKLQLATEPLAVVIRRGATAMMDTAARANVALVLDLPAALPMVDVDGQRIAQVLINLLSNAIRHTPAGGEVRISAEAGAEDVQVRVRDSGAGIPTDALGRVFDRFYRVDPSRSRGSGGSGLGLAIARQLVRAHDGEIWAENNEGDGATFTFSIPLKRAEHGAATVPEVQRGEPAAAARPGA